MDKTEFNKLIKEEKFLYLGNDVKCSSFMKKTQHKRYVIWKYLYYFRVVQYCYENIHYKSISKLNRYICRRFYKFYIKKRNIYSYLSGVEIGNQCHIGKNCDIWHSGVVINANIGDNCVFHGNNILGNKGYGHENDIPTIGNNVDIGAGAVIIGDITISDGCIIGANAVVTKSFLKPNTVIVGVPGKELYGKEIK